MYNYVLHKRQALNPSQIPFGTHRLADEPRTFLVYLPKKPNKRMKLARIELSTIALKGQYRIHLTTAP